MSLDSYRERVRALAQKRDGEPIFNGSLDHSGIIIEQMFASAHDQVSILTGALNARVYGTDTVLKQAELFLADPSHTVSIILEDASEENLRGNPFFKKFKNYPNVDVRQVRARARGLFGFHFLIVDGDTFRWEPNKNEPAAIAVFGDEETTANLRELFGDLKKSSEPVDVEKVLTHA